MWDPDQYAYRDIVLELLAAVMMKRNDEGSEKLHREAEVHHMALLMEAVYSCEPSSCLAFWQGIWDGPTHPLAPVLESAMHRYPLDCVTITRLCSSLAGDAATAQQVFLYLGGAFHKHPAGEPIPATGAPPHAKLFTREPPPRSIALHVVAPSRAAGSSAHIVELGQHYLYPVESLVMPAGTRGRLIVPPSASHGGAQDPTAGAVITWAHPHSAWPVLLSRLASVAAQAAANGGSAVGYDAAVEAAATVGLLGQLLMCRPQMAAELAAHLEVSGGGAVKHTVTGHGVTLLLSLASL